MSPNGLDTGRTAGSAPPEGLRNGSHDPDTELMRMLGFDQELSALSLVEIAQALERVTGLIEQERVREREARAKYRLVADDVNERITSIRDSARVLVTEQRRRMVSFDGMLEAKPLQGAPNGEIGSSALSIAADLQTGAPRKMNLLTAILQIWRLEKYVEPLTTGQIAKALPEVGYHTRAAPNSLKSTLNQALAKLVRERKMRRFRIDGEELDYDDEHSRARRYMPA